MVKVTTLTKHVIEALMFTVLGYVITAYFMTTVADSMDVTIPDYFTTLGLGIVFIIILFAIVIYVIAHAGDSSQKD